MSEKAEVTRNKKNAIILREENPNEKGYQTTNKVFVRGIIEDELEYSHTILWEKFYRTKIIIKRLSGTKDYIPILISEFLISEKIMNKSLKNKWVEGFGQFRSHNSKMNEDGKSHLDLYVFITDINIYENEYEMEENEKANNMIYLDGYICKQPIFRQTPSERKITDLLIAVNRSYGKADYIPCIAWGRVAEWAAYLDIGTRVELNGRIQSRKYLKKPFPDSEVGERKIAYEVSITRMQKVLLFGTKL